MIIKSLLLVYYYGENLLYYKIKSKNLNFLSFLLNKDSLFKEMRYDIRLLSGNGSLFSIDSAIFISIM